MKTTTEQFNAVTEFMRIGSQEVLSTYKHPSTKLGKFRLRLIDEEINGKNELIDSVDDDNAVGIIDGLCDILYVTYGAMAAFGMQPIEYNAQAEPDPSKPSILDIGSAWYHTKHIKGAYEQLERGLLSTDEKTVRSALDNLVKGVYFFGNASNYNLNDAFAEVHSSNMSKFCSSHEEAWNTIRAKADGEKYGEDINDVKKVDVDGTEYYIIVRTSDGKVMKGPNFFEPDLSKFVVHK